MELWLYTLGSLVLVSGMSLIGIVTLVRGQDRLRGLTTYLVSLAVGALLGGAVLHLIPGALETRGPGLDLWLLVLAGFVVSFILEKFLWAHHHGHELGHSLETKGAHLEEAHPGDDEGMEEEGMLAGLLRRPMATMVLLGGAVHNLIDGVVIASAYLIDPGIGVVATVAVVLHEVPQELGDFGVLVHAGIEARRALILNLLSATTALLAGVVTLLVGTRVEALSSFVVPVAAGNFLYIAAADLVPELHQKRGAWASLAQVAVMLLGIGLMLAVKLVEEAL